MTLSQLRYVDSESPDNHGWTGGLDHLQKLNGSPAAVVFKKHFYVFFQEFNGSGRLQYLKYDLNVDGLPSTPTLNTVPGVDMSGNPAIAIYYGELYCAFQSGYYSTHIRHVTFDGSNWTKPQEIPGTMSASPALAVFQGHLYCFHRGRNSATLWYTSFNGIQWSAEMEAPVSSLSDSPAVAVYNETLYCAHQRGGHSSEILYSTFDGNNWSNSTPLNISTTGSPSLFVYNDRLYLAHQGVDNAQSLWITYLEGDSWLPDTRIASGVITASPCLIECGGFLLCFYQRALYNSLTFLRKSFQIINKDIPLLDVWGEGRIIEGTIASGATFSGFRQYINLNLYKQLISNGVNTDCAIPNIMPVSNYDAPDFPIKDEKVEVITLMGAPITAQVADEMIRVLKTNGKIFLYDPSRPDRETFEDRVRLKVRAIDTSHLPYPLNQVSFRPVYGYQKHRN